MPPYIFGIVGESQTGKTTMVQRLLLELARRGHRIGILKDDSTGDDVDQGGKGAWRHGAAGAAASLVMGPNHVSLFRQGPPPPPEALLPLLEDVDLVLAEGFREAAWPKLEIHRGSGPLTCAGDPWLVAVAGPKQLRGCPVPWYHWDEIVQIANAVENARSLGLARR